MADPHFFYKQKTPFHFWSLQKFFTRHSETVKAGSFPPEGSLDSLGKGEYFFIAETKNNISTYSHKLVIFFNLL